MLTKAIRCPISMEMNWEININNVPYHLMFNNLPWEPFLASILEEIHLHFNNQ